MFTLRVTLGPLVLVDLILFGTQEPDAEEVEEEPSAVERLLAALSDDGGTKADRLLPFGFGTAERAEPAPDPVFRDLEA